MHVTSHVLSQWEAIQATSGAGKATQLVSRHVTAILYLLPC